MKISVEVKLGKVRRETQPCDDGHEGKPQKKPDYAHWKH